MVTGDYEKARIELNKSMQLDSTLVFNESNLAELLLHEGKYDSVALVDRGLGGPATALVRLVALRKQGNTAHARTLSDSLAAELNAPHRDDDGTGHALLFAAIGEPDSAFRYLNHMVDVKAGFIFTAGIPCYFAFQPLYTDPRWDLLLHRINAVRCKR
jgi:hypothetical protein